MRSNLGFLIFTLVLIAIDLYVFKGLRVILSDSPKLIKLWVSIGYWALSIGLLVTVLYTIWSYSRSQEMPNNQEWAFTVFGILILFLVPKLVFVLFHLVEDVLQLGITGWQHFFSPPKESLPGDPMKRITFISRVGLALAAIPFLGIGYGMVRGRFDFRVERASLGFPHLPSSFDGLRIVQISDFHLGSFFDRFDTVEKGLKMIRDLEPDIILFTGDMVNNHSIETRGWEPYLERLSAPLGKYAILGNHDYGDYTNWPSEEAKRENLDRLKSTITEKMGFRLLLNENVKVERNGESFELIGVENWGTGGFAKYGDLDEAMKGTDPENFQLLLSHDPSHWDAQVMNKTRIDLTLSGHTHGMQFGVEIPGIKWSPVQYRYPRWGGLYNEGNQFLYVNRGFGYIGFPGRVGIPPEITLIELNRDNGDTA